MKMQNKKKRIIKPMKRRNCIPILLITYDQPGNGGASSNMYQIYKYFKNHSSIFFDCYIIFVADKLIFKVENNIIRDPNVLITSQKKFPTQYTFVVKKFKKYNEVTIIFKIYKTYECIIKKFFNRKPFNKKIYLVSGLKILNNFFNLEKDLNKIIDVSTDLKNIIKYTNKNEIIKELYPIINSDKIIFNSQLTFEIFKNLLDYSNFSDDKIFSKINVINTSIFFPDIKNKYSKSKKYDILFSSSNYLRNIKNPNLVIRLFSNKKMEEFKKIIIGKNFPETINDIKNLTHFKNLPQNNFHEILSETKLVIILSFYDSSPNLLYESMALGCKTLISQNVGRYDKLNSDILYLDDDEDTMIEKIKKKIEIDNENILEDMIKYREIEQNNLLKLVIN